MNKTQYNILVVEDEPVWQDLFCDTLRDMGCHVDVAPDFSAGKKKTAQHSYDLVLFDVGLDQPGFNAICQQFCQALRARFPDVPFLAMSGKNLTPMEMATLFRDYSPADFIWKGSLNLSTFQRQIKLLLASQNPDPSRPPTPAIILLTVNKHETNALLDVFMGPKRMPSLTTKGGVTYNHLGTHE